MFPCMIARTATTDVISSGMGGTRNGALQLVEFYNSIINEHLINYFLLIILVYKKIKIKLFFLFGDACRASSTITFGPRT